MRAHRFKGGRLPHNPEAYPCSPRALAPNDAHPGPVAYIHERGQVRVAIMSAAIGCARTTLGILAIPILLPLSLILSTYPFPRLPPPLEPPPGEEATGAEKETGRRRQEESS